MGKCNISYENVLTYLSKNVSHTFEIKKTGRHMEVKYGLAKTMCNKLKC